MRDESQISVRILLPAPGCPNEREQAHILAGFSRPDESGFESLTLCAEAHSEDFRTLMTPEEEILPAAMPALAH
jgi:hypothetical protein